MDKFTLPTKEQIEGKQERIFKKINIDAEITDYYLLLGGGIPITSTNQANNGNSNPNNNQVNNDTKLRKGEYWVKDERKGNEPQGPYVNATSKIGEINKDNYEIGCRPITSYSQISSECYDEQMIKGGIIQVTYGEYPQYVVDKQVQSELEQACKYNKLSKTGKLFTRYNPSINYNDASLNRYNPSTLAEYIYNGKKYVRFVGLKDVKNNTLSNGEPVLPGQIYWLEVAPVHWYIDKTDDIAISEKILFAGVQYYSQQDRKQGDDFDYDTSTIKKYLEKSFRKEILGRKGKNTKNQKKGAYKNKKITSSKNYMPTGGVPQPCSTNPPQLSTTKTINKKTIKKKNTIKESTTKIHRIRRNNPFQLVIKNVTEENIIKGSIESDLPVFLHGPSSEGKSARIKAIDPKCVTLYLSNSSPESLNGKSVYNSEIGEMLDIKPSWLKKLEARCKEDPDNIHIVFFDELTNALPSIQGMAFNIILNKEVNGIWKLPKNARIVAAGNETTDSLSAYQLSEPLYNRFVHVKIKTTTDGWLKWASDNDIHPAIRSYITSTGENLRTPFTGEKPNADPRKWEMASKMLYKTKNPEMLRGLLGEEVTKKFISFLNQQEFKIKDFSDKKYFSGNIRVLTKEERKKITSIQSQIKKVTEEDIIKGALESDVPVFLHGPSSEGKSARIKAIDPECITLYLGNTSPESLNGKSVYNSETGEMIDIKPSWLKKLEARCEEDPDNIHIVFFDEITNALPSIQGMAFNIILSKEVNGIWELPKNARIAAAGNEMKDSLSAYELSEPLYNRFAHVYIKTTPEGWLKWASENDIHPAIYSYIASTNGATLRTKFTGEDPNADPRKWEMASKMLYQTNNPEMLRGLLGEAVTKEFITFCKQPLITIKDVLENNYTIDEIKKLTIDERYQIAYSLSQVKEENLDEVRRFMLKVGKEPTKLFDTIWVHNSPERLERLQEAILENEQATKSKNATKSIK